MGYQNAYTAYQRTNVSTASQGRLVVLLYEGAVKHLTAAINLIESDSKIKPNNIEQFGIHIQKAQSIITELQVSLDMEKGGDIARNLMSLYVYFTKLQLILKMISDLTESWRMVANSTANAPAATISKAVNIEG